MQYNQAPWMPQQQPQPTNNLWVGNNYSGMSANRSAIGQPQYPQMPYQPEPLPQTMNNVLSVMGPDSANEFKVGPNSKVILMDAYRPVFYRKWSDDSGFAETRAFQFFEIPLNEVTNLDNKRVEPATELLESSETVTRADIDELKQMIATLQHRDMNANDAVPSLFITKDEFNDFKKTVEDCIKTMEELVMKDA